jgi:dienelactone hydrolase
VELGEPEDLGDYTRQPGRIRAEPTFETALWFLRPKGEGPFPFALTPHGHGEWGMDMYAGLPRNEADRMKMEVEDRDVAVQAVKRGFVAVAPATRGFEPAAIPDLTKRHGGRGCRSYLVHTLLAGRTTIGDRVWDMQRLLDWGLALPGVDADRVLVMGNSGGGVVTLYTAACDTRVKVAVSSCSFCTYVAENGHVHHCDCNLVPGILTFGEMHDVAGLVAPRHLLVVHGRKDDLFPATEVDRAVNAVREAYVAAGEPARFAHRLGEGGHRFYKNLMWPFIENALGLSCSC